MLLRRRALVRRQRRFDAGGRCVEPVHVAHHRPRSGVGELDRLGRGRALRIDQEQGCLTHRRGQQALAGLDRRDVKRLGGRPCDVAGVDRLRVGGCKPLRGGDVTGRLRGHVELPQRESRLGRVGGGALEREHPGYRHQHDHRRQHEDPVVPHRVANLEWGSAPASDFRNRLQPISPLQSPVPAPANCAHDRHTPSRVAPVAGASRGGARTPRRGYIRARMEVGGHRPALDVVVPFFGPRASLERLVSGMATLPLGEADTLTIVDNRPPGAEPVRGVGRAEVIQAPERQSSYYARNRGAERGRAEWLLFLDADVTPGARPARALLRPAPVARPPASWVGRSRTRTATPGRRPRPASRRSGGR